MNILEVSNRFYKHARWTMLCLWTPPPTPWTGKPGYADVDDHWLYYITLMGIANFVGNCCRKCWTDMVCFIADWTNELHIMICTNYCQQLSIRQLAHHWWLSDEWHSHHKWMPVFKIERNNISGLRLETLSYRKLSKTAFDVLSYCVIITMRHKMSLVLIHVLFFI
jgi:hypothetical protein